MAFYSGLACRPADTNLPNGDSLCPRDSNPGWGDWRRSICGWGGFLLFGRLGKIVSVLLLVTRLGLMPCSAWSKKKSGSVACIAPVADFQYLGSICT